MWVDDSFQRREILEEIRDLYLRRIADNKEKIREIHRHPDLSQKAKRDEKGPFIRENTIWRLRLAVMTDWLMELNRGYSAEEVAAEPAATSSIRGNSDGRSNGPSVIPTQDMVES